MDAGQWLTRGTVWLALSLYVAGEVIEAAKSRRAGGAARRLNTAGCVVFLVHVACAFHFYHDWSHAAAYAETARQTAELAGWNWGGGLWFNYAFALVWLGEVIWRWTGSKSYAERPRWLAWSVRAFFLFMILNGAVVFVQSAMRWYGLLLCFVLAACWWRRNQNGSRTVR